jgi:hypothetical protein
MDDNPKLPVTSAQATFMNGPMSRWLAARNVGDESVWPREIQPERRTLWTARLFPVEMGPRSTRWLEWFQKSARDARGARSEWLAEPRLSLEEVFEMADSERTAGGPAKNNPTAPSLDALCERVSRILQQGQDGNVETTYRNFDDATQFLRLKSALDELALRLPCSLRRARIFKVLADMMADDALARFQKKLAKALRPGASISLADDRAMLQLWGGAYEELAFANVRLAIEASARTPKQHPLRRLVPGVALRVEVPARIDLGGGWSDTPPYSLEKGGAVVNMAVTLDGECPVMAWAKTLSQPIIRLGSLDQGISNEIANLEDMGTYDDVEDPLALLKAAVVFEGFAPRGGTGPVKAHMQRLGAGLELITECRLPKGSGMGTSSILAAAAVAALSGLRGQPLDVKELFNHVLCVEQMMTTGGGWQDQVGGAVGGVKYILKLTDFFEVFEEFY